MDKKDTNERHIKEILIVIGDSLTDVDSHSIVSSLTFLRKSSVKKFRSEFIVGFVLIIKCALFQISIIWIK